MTQQGASKENASHVHFDSAQLSKEHDSEISVEAADSSTRVIHLGFLKLRRTYLIEFDVEDSFRDSLGSELPFSEHVHLKKFEANSSGTGHHVALTLHAYKDKLLRERFVIESNSNGQQLTFLLVARVLGKHKGTPSLKTGIRCIGVTSDAGSSSDDDDEDFRKRSPLSS